MRLTSGPGARPRIPLSVLDFGQLSQGQSTSGALKDTVSLAQRADSLGYQRFWVSEHHATPWLASTSPAVLVAHLATQTRRIRVGSGGVMLSNHAPLVVAEQFALLEALHPGRVDLGLGRAPGADARTAAALRRSAAGLDDNSFRRQVQEVLTMVGLEQTTKDGRSTAEGSMSATPAAVSAPLPWLLGSSSYSARLAGSLRLPYCFAAHNGAPAEVAAAALSTYRAAFDHEEAEPSPTGSSGARGPATMVSVTVLAADTEQEVERLARPGRLQRYAERTGRPVTPLLSPDGAARVLLPARDESAIRLMPSGGVAGTPDRVVEGLEQFIAETGADELLLCSFVHGARTRVRTLELVADAWGLSENRTVREPAS